MQSICEFTNWKLGITFAYAKERLHCRTVLLLEHFVRRKIRLNAYNIFSYLIDNNTNRTVNHTILSLFYAKFYVKHMKKLNIY